MSCNKNETTNNQAELIEEPTEAADPISDAEDFEEDVLYAQAIVDKLRMRAEPNLKSEVLFTFQENQRMIFLGEKSSFTETVELRGEPIAEYWYLVKHYHFEGWVFGGAIKFLDDKNEDSFRVVKLSSQEVEDIIGLDIENKDGFKQMYVLTDIDDLNDPNKTGYIEAKGRYFIEDIGSEFQDVYRGQFIKGKREGRFSKEVLGGEEECTFSLFFEDDNCNRGYIRCVLNGEEESTYSYDNLKACTFQALYDEYLVEILPD